MSSSGSSITVGFSFANGLYLMTVTVLLGWISQLGWFQQSFPFLSFRSLTWIVLPIVGYLFAFGLNAGIQYLSCSSVQLKQVAMNSIFTPVAILGFLLISLLSIFTSPVIGVLPFSITPSLKIVLAVSFFMFWAGMFGEAIGSGFAQSCGAS